MGSDRPGRDSKTRAINRLISDPHELDSDDSIQRPSRRRRSSRIPVPRPAAEDNEVSDSADDDPVGVGVYTASPPDASLEAPTIRTRRASQPNAVLKLEPNNGAPDNTMEDGDFEMDSQSGLGIGDDDEDITPDTNKQPKAEKSVIVRLPVSALPSAQVTKFGRPVRKPVLTVPVEASLRRRSSSRDIPRTSDVLSRRRNRISRYNNLADLDDNIDDLDDEVTHDVRRSKRRRISNPLASVDADDEDFETPVRHAAKEVNPNRRRTRLRKTEEYQNGRTTRASLRRRAENEADTRETSPYPTRNRTGHKHAGDEEHRPRNGTTLKKQSEEDDENEVAKEDVEYEVSQTDEESEEPDEAGVEEQELSGGGPLETIEDLDHQPSPRTRSKKRKKDSTSKRKRGLGRDHNSLATAVKKSFRPRNDAFMRSSLYRDPGDPSTDSSFSSIADRPKRSLLRPVREAANRASDAIANEVGNVDYVTNPMAGGTENPKPQRSRRPDRIIRHKGKLRPTRPDPFASDDDSLGPVGTSGAIEPIEVDLNLSWNDVGGLEHHIRSLKETVFLPLMYPEVFEKFKMEAPKGVLFYGPPGTGKTLCARALAASCGAQPEPAKLPSNLAPKQLEAAETANPIGQAQECGVNTTAVSKDSDINMKDVGEATEEPVATEEKPIATNEDPNIPDGQKISPTMLMPSSATREATAELNAHPTTTNDIVTATPTDTEAPKFLKSSALAMGSHQNPVPPVKKKPRVAFFMRNGADCLSKWVGEAERQLRMTFEAAKRHQPAIIFFDEIDGLAPVRSSRQDQIHSSIVSTLLGLMDGLDNRGKVVVIGATNRVDAIDPALRRPGRFDRELIFTLPNAIARRKILDIHTTKWTPPPKASVLDAVAKMTVGYCGADLRNLCSESALRALRRRYPQVYQSNDKLVIDVNEVKVTTKDFLAAMSEVVPASHRSARTYAKPVPERLRDVLRDAMDSCLGILRRIFPQGVPKNYVPSTDGTMSLNALSNESLVVDDISSSDDDDEDMHLETMTDKIIHAGKIRQVSTKTSTIRYHTLRPRLLICGEQGLGQPQIGPAILHACEGCPVHAIDFPSLHADGGARSAEEALVTAFREAARSVPSILYLPHLQLWWESASESLRTTLIIALKDLPSDLPLLVLATAEVASDCLPPAVLELFGELHQLEAPSTAVRAQLFNPLLQQARMRPKSSEAAIQKRRKNRVLEVLPKAPPPRAKKLTPDEDAKRVHHENRCIRALRMEMREFVEMLLRDTKFKAFWTPVDPTSAPDYYDIITIPMDIQKIAANVDCGAYPTVLAMVRDFDIMVQNAIQYNPPNTEVGAAILRRAHGLIDIVHTWMDNLSPALVETCNKIVADRITRYEAASGEKEENKADGVAKDFGDMAKENVAVEVESVPSEKANTVEPAQVTVEDVGEQEVVDVDKTASSPPRSRSKLLSIGTLHDEFGLGSDENFVPAPPLHVEALEKLVVDVSTGMTVDALEELYVRCEKVLHDNRHNFNRAFVVDELCRTVTSAREDPALVGQLVE